MKKIGIQVYHDVSPKLDILTDFVDVHADPQQNAEAHLMNRLPICISFF